MSEPAVASAFQPLWTQQLSTQYLVNSVAISDDGSRVVAGTFYHDYSQAAPAGPVPDLRALEPLPASPGISPYGQFGIYCFDNTGTQIWSDVENMFEGVYWVAISGNAQVAAAAGWYSDSPNSTPPTQGLLKIYSTLDGTVLLNYTQITNRVNAVSLSSNGTLAAAIAANTIYVFAQQNGVYSNPATMTVQSSLVEAIAVHPDGQWLVAADINGNVYLVLTPNGQIQASYTYQVPTQKTIHSVAIAGESNYFVAGADDGTVYVFELNAMIQNQAPVATANLSQGVGIRWVAANGNCSLITAVYNQSETGMLAALSFDGQNLTSLWQNQLNQMPNSTSIDAVGVFITAADGYQGAGDFYLYNASGNLLGSLPTLQMCWPMFVSTNGTAIAAGSDNGTLYYFTTPASRA
jgi:WD40 repeat protein